MLFANSVWFLSQQNLLYLQGLLDGACVFLFLSEKTNKSNRLQMSLQTQNFLPRSGPGFETATSRSADRRFSVELTRRRSTEVEASRNFRAENHR